MNSNKYKQNISVEEKIRRILASCIAFVLLLSSGISVAQSVDISDFDKTMTGSLNAVEEFQEEYSAAPFSPVLKTALNARVTVTRKNATLRDCLRALAEKSGIKLLFNDGLVDGLYASMDYEDITLAAALEMLLADKGLAYREFEKGQIVLFRRNAPAAKSGSVKGTVRDEKNEVLYAATVVIEGTALGAATGINGDYSIHNVKPGVYRVKASYMGYVPVEKRVIVEEGKTANADFVLKPTSFQIGGIEVVGVTDLLPTDAATKTSISSGEIEHFQASSVKDVLSLVPGVAKTDNPGLGKTGQIAVRGMETNNLSALGTLIMVDGIPVSNNANLQFEGNYGSKSGLSNTGAGADLRTIPADNLNSIEVISGLPSVRYGDATEGVINIRTKIGSQPNRLKIKQNPDTEEANFGGGTALNADNSLSYNFNAARSERDLRLTGDEYTRLTGEMVHSRKFEDLNFTMYQKLKGQRIFDEEQPKGDVWKTQNYNRTFSVGYANWGKYVPEGEVSSIEYNLFLDYKNVNSMKSKFVQSDLRILASGDTIGSYMGKVETKGREWNLGGRLEYNRTMFTGDLVHKLLLGTDIQYNANTGDGVMTDSIYNYYGAFSGFRSYKFDEIPGQTLVSLYAEDRITWHAGFDFCLQIGMRYEMYNPTGFRLKGFWGDGDLVKSRQGSFFNPRANFMIYFTEYNQLRLTAGTSSKSPSMSMIYKMPESYIWRDPETKKNIVFLYDLRTPDLKGYRNTQYEIAYDHKLFRFLGTSLSAYYKERSGEPGEQEIPVYYWNSVNNKNNIYYVDVYKINLNINKTITRGIEFKLRSNQIKPLNMNFSINGAYSFVKYSKGSTSYYNTPDAKKGQYPNVKVTGAPVDTMLLFGYPTTAKWYENFQLNYYITYTLPRLGLWMTLTAEHVLIENDQQYISRPEDYNLLTEAGKAEYNLTREIKRKGSKWLLNLNISKSLFRGAEVSFYVNNFLDDPALRIYYSKPSVLDDEIRNPKLFYGIEFSYIIDEIFRRDN